MPDNTLTIALNGNIFIEDFTEAVNNFTALVGALSREIAEGVHIDWEIVELSAGSASLTVAGRAAHPPLVTRVTEAYVRIGEAVAAGTPFPYSDRIADRVSTLTEIIDGNVTSIELSASGRTTPTIPGR